MNNERSKQIFWMIAGTLILFSAIVIVAFFYLMLTQPQIVPSSETLGSFWLKNFAVLVAALAFASSALAASYNSLEQRHLRYMENYPYLEIHPFLSVDPLSLPIPKVDLPDELDDFNLRYLEKVSPSQSIKVSDIEFRYLGIILRNVGHGRITHFSMRGIAQIPNLGLPEVGFKIDRKVSLPAEGTLAFTVLPIAGLPEFKVIIKSLEYNGHVVKLNDFDGEREFHKKYPYTVPADQREVIFLDDFNTFPQGQNWVLDFWGQWKYTNYIYVPAPAGDKHHLMLSGDVAQFSNHFNNRGGASRDLLDILDFGETVQVTARVKADSDSKCCIQLWCHDLAANEKSRCSDKITPSSEWQDISLCYTSTQTRHLRIHLLYFPGTGFILVDKVTVEKLRT